MRRLQNKPSARRVSSEEEDSDPMDVDDAFDDEVDDAFDDDVDDEDGESLPEDSEGLGESDEQSADEIGLTEEELDAYAQRAASEAVDALGDGPSQATEPLTRDSLSAFSLDPHGYADALDEGYHALVEKLSEVEVPLRPGLEKLEPAMFRQVALLVLATIPTCLLREVIAGNLAYAYRGLKKPDVEAVVARYNEDFAKDHVPAVYQLTLAASSGRSPTKEEWVEICDTWEVYMDYETTDKETLKMVYEVDRIGHIQQDQISVRNGVRRCCPAPTGRQKAPDPLEPEQVRYLHLEPSQTKLETIRTFLDAVRQRIAEADTGEHLSMTYAGYAREVRSRWKHHKENPHNYLMGGSRAIAQYLFPKRRFSLKTFVVAPVAFEEEATIAEVLVCALGNSYYTSGYGFNIADAGESVKSIEKLQPIEKYRMWGWINKYSPRKANMKQQIETLTEKCRDLSKTKQILRKLLQEKKDELDEMVKQGLQDEAALIQQKIIAARLETKFLQHEGMLHRVSLAIRNARLAVLKMDMERLDRVQAIFEKHGYGV